MLLNLCQTMSDSHEFDIPKLEDTLLLQMFFKCNSTDGITATQNRLFFIDSKL